MQQSKLRRQIAWEAARLMYSREESEYFRAKQKAAHRICQGWVKPADLPSNAEIRAQYRKLVADNHPDKLIGRGVPAEFVDLATRKLAAINAAYDSIAKERGL